MDAFLIENERRGLLRRLDELSSAHRGRPPATAIPDMRAACAEAAAALRADEGKWQAVQKVTFEQDARNRHLAVELQAALQRAEVAEGELAIALGSSVDSSPLSAAPGPVSPPETQRTIDPCRQAESALEQLTAGHASNGHLQLRLPIGPVKGVRVNWCATRGGAIFFCGVERA